MREESADPKLRPAMEIQKAHDVLVAVVAGEVDLPIADADRRHLQAHLDALCWVLRHDHNSAFANNLERVMQDLSARGYVLRGPESAG